MNRIRRSVKSHLQLGLPGICLGWCLTQCAAFLSSAQPFKIYEARETDNFCENSERGEFAIKRSQTGVPAHRLYLRFIQAWHKLYGWIDINCKLFCQFSQRPNFSLSFHLPPTACAKASTSDLLIKGLVTFKHIGLSLCWRLNPVQAKDWCQQDC